MNSPSEISYIMENNQVLVRNSVVIDLPVTLPQYYRLNLPVGTMLKMPGGLFTITIPMCVMRRRMVTIGTYGPQSGLK